MVKLNPIKMKFYYKLAFFAVTTVSVMENASAANILFYWGVSGMSHRISVWPLVETLAERGHNVTFFSPLPGKKPNPKVHEIIPENLLKDVGLDLDFISLRTNGGPEAMSKLWSTFFDFAINNCKAVVNNQYLVNWIQNSSYDLVILNGMFNDCGYGLVHKFKAPYIIYGTTSAFGWWSEAYGYADENYPEFQYHYPMNMTFMQSVLNALRPLYWQWNRQWYVFPKLESILKQGLKLDDLPPLATIENNPSLVLMNVHYSEEYPRSMPPLFVQIGGMHCTDDIKPLPKDILDFVESGENGFIYFSFGTFAKSESLEVAIRDKFFSAMRRFNTTKFLIKWHDLSTEGLPSNIKKFQWVSQQDVLAHPNIKAFISHGGLLGIQEAVYHGVPMIVVPLFAEQDYNAERVEARGRGLRLEISNTTEEQLVEAIQEILGNIVYKENTKQASRLFKDRPSKPVDTAVWWVEYVLRNGDTSHLRPVGMTRNWYQRRMLDIWSFIALILIGLITAVGITFYVIVKMILNINSTPQKVKEASKNLKKVQ